MLINEVCRECSLTKKAVEYYMAQELISPAVLENGYRNFSQEDVEKLKKIAILRNLGLSIADIHDVLSSQSKTAKTALNEICHKKTMQMNLLQEKQNLLQELAATYDWAKIQGKLQQLNQKQSILERLMNLFPGFYGKYLFLHFAPYLSEPILTKEQQEAFDTIIAFLDTANFTVPADLQAYMEELTTDYDEKVFEDISFHMKNAIQNMDKYILDNKEIIEKTIACKQSEAYKSSPAFRLEKFLRQFNSLSGYNDIFIPAMCRLSKSYCDYHEALQKADKRFLQQCPEYASYYQAIKPTAPLQATEPQACNDAEHNASHRTL